MSIVERSAKQLMMDVLPECADAREAMVLIAHCDGTISWHGTSDVSHSKLGIFRFVTLLVEQQILQAPDCESKAPKEIVH